MRRLHPLLHCRAFSCRWLIDASTAKMRRPDKTGYVIDPMPDTIVANGKPLDVVQVWVAHPDAHLDPDLRAWLNDIALRIGIPALIRDNPQDGWLLVPPALSDNGDWLEIRTAKARSEEDMASVRQAAMARLFADGT